MNPEWVKRVMPEALYDFQIIWYFGMSIQLLSPGVPDVW